MNSLGLLLLPGASRLSSRSPSHMQDSGVKGGREGHRPGSQGSLWLWHFTSMHSTWVYEISRHTATRFKPWPLTSTCNWRHSSKWENALAGPGPVESYKLPPAVKRWLPLIRSTKRVYPVWAGVSPSCLSPIFWVHEIWSLSPPSKQEKGLSMSFWYRKSDAEPRSEGGFWESRITPIRT